MLRVSVLLAAGLAAWSLSAGNVELEVSPLSLDTYQYSFQLTGFSLPGEALDIQFDPGVYVALANASGPAGFDITALQPNNPPGATGDLIVEEASGETASADMGIFDVDVTLAATGQPGNLPFFLYSIDSSGMFEDLIQSGETSLASGALATPEPWDFWFTGFSFLALGALRKFLW